jgi:hypothetical protein
MARSFHRQNAESPNLHNEAGHAGEARSDARSAAVCAFSVTSRVTQRDGGTGRGHAEKPHLAARRPGTHWRAPPRRSGDLTARRSLARWMIPGWHPFRLSRITPGPQASGRQPAIQEPSTSSCSIGAPRPGLPAHPCAVTHDQPYREGWSSANSRASPCMATTGSFTMSDTGGSVVKTSASRYVSGSGNAPHAVWADEWAQSAVAVCPGGGMTGLPGDAPVA